MAHQFVDVARQVAALDMSDRDAEMDRRDRRGQYLPRSP